jgi:serine phosphatase RsbU (regulator of sigma subunit)
MDAAVADQFGDAWFATVRVAELDLETGQLEILNAGHPQPLLFRAGQPPRRIPVKPCRPVGLGTEPTAPHVEQLEEGDVVVFHTDGISEARSSSGVPFGEDRLAAELDRLLAEGHQPAEVLRLLIHDVLAYQDGPARDDASLVLLGWRHSHSMVPGGLDVTS